jgi:hypothetical protein
MDLSGSRRDQWRAPVNMVMNLCVSQRVGNLLVSEATISF